MTNTEKKKKAKKRADLITDTERIIFQGGAVIILFKLLYKKKIRPLTAAFLATAYRLGNKDVVESTWDNIYHYSLDVDGYYDEPEKRDYKMGFDIQ